MVLSASEKESILEKLRAGDSDIKDDITSEIPQLCSDLAGLRDQERLIDLRILGNAVADHDCNRKLLLDQDSFFQYLNVSKVQETSILLGILFNLYNGYEGGTERLYTIAPILHRWITSSSTAPETLPEELIVFLLGRISQHADSGDQSTTATKTLGWSNAIIDYLLKQLIMTAAEYDDDTLEIVQVLGRVLGIDQDFEKYIASREDYIVVLLDSFSQYEKELGDWGIGILGTVSSHDTFLETVPLEKSGNTSIYAKILDLTAKSPIMCSIAGCILSNLASNSTAAEKVAADIDFANYIDKCKSMNMIQLQCINLLKNVSNQKDLVQKSLVPCGLLDLLDQICKSQTVVSKVKVMAFAVARNVFRAYDHKYNTATEEVNENDDRIPQKVKALGELMLSLYPTDDPNLQEELVNTICAGNPRVLYANDSQKKLAECLLDLKEQNIQTSKCLALIDTQVLTTSVEDKLDALLQSIKDQPKPVQNNLAYLASELIALQSSTASERLLETSKNAIAFYSTM